MKFPWWIILFWILFCMGMFPGFPLLYPKWFDKLTKEANEIDIFFNYDLLSYSLGDDYPIVDLAYEVFDGLDNLIGSGVTDDLGHAIFPLLNIYDTTGDGIHVVYNYKSFERQLSNLAAGIYEEELTAFRIQSSMYWDDMTPLSGGIIIELWLNGEFLSSITTTPGYFGTSLLPAVNYTLKSSLFDDYGLTVNFSASSYTKDIIVTAKSFSISENMEFIPGIFYFIFFFL